MMGMDCVNHAEHEKYCITPWGCLSSVLKDYGIDISHISGTIGTHMVEDFMEMMIKAGYVERQGRGMDLIDRQAAIDAIKELCQHYTPTKSVNHPHMNFVIEELENLPSAQPDVPDTNVGDMISRQTPIEARRYTFGNDEFSLEDAYHDCKLVFDGITDDDSFQEADTGLILYYANEIIYALQEALDKDTNVPTNDCISRQKAIDAFWELDIELRPSAIDAITGMLKELPSVQPERKGKWIMTDFPDEQTYKCSACGEIWTFIDGTPEENGAFFCPSCGADMRGE